MKKSIFVSSVIFLCFFLCSFEKIETKIIEKENKELVNLFFETKVEETYLGILEIPNINLKRGFYDYNSKENTVEKNIEVINAECLPNETCDFILASHSGTSSIAYFKHLHKLKKEDIAYLYYQNKKYTYRLSSIEYTEKNGSIAIVSNAKPRLILTTCNKTNDNLQDIYYFELINTEEY